MPSTRRSIERERAVLTDKAKASGKPEAVIAKMVEGGLRKFFEDVVLLEQTYVIDGESKVKDVIDDGGQGGRRAGEGRPASCAWRWARGSSAPRSERSAGVTAALPNFATVPPASRR